VPVPADIVDLHDALIEQYDTNDMSKQAHALFIDTLKQYTSAVIVASTRATCKLLGIDEDNVQMLALTERQYHRLEESGMLERYIEGGEGTDD